MIKQGKRLAALMLVIISQCLSASESVTDEESLLNDIFPEQCHFSGHFTQQKNVEGLPVPLKSDGDFFYSCNLGLIWHTRSPFEETILYVNSANNYRVEENGSLSPLTGVTRYIMSHVFVRVLQADTDYFVEEFAISQTQDNESVELKPESEFMKKGLQSIRFKKAEDAKAGVSLMVSVLDATGQVTDVNINNIEAYNIEGKRRAFEQCEQLYADNRQWCQILRSPSRADRL
ncbi:outer membrane lipoprotein carrier protein LolA [Alteromonas pelagimontana]|uniref:Outer membrane lipoprotein carrier protein LolA n=1 Tax=Alteromonas pelagimontana TaxID=1858656 RepID=A0A6M4MEC9_9ALTE|nr:outer membrane lipoprotein carrier protein LolA [Alteromonas pelagimontana]QJR80935.1 outer membrane lipoprotein carrier protein LolA [Alteromonas pelagimontana]